MAALQVESPFQRLLDLRVQCRQLAGLRRPPFPAPRRTVWERLDATLTCLMMAASGKSAP